MASKQVRSVNHQYFIGAPPDSVFRAISDATWLTRWLCDRADLSPKDGGSYLLAWNDGPTHTGRIVGFRDGQRIALEWSWPGVTLQGTVLSLSVEPKDAGTILTVDHSGFPRDQRWTDLYGSAEWGWTYFALNLKSVLEKGHDLRSKYDG
jgi:uncharacterized protein YndB with AHSA1/START domain